MAQRQWAIENTICKQWTAGILAPEPCGNGRAGGGLLLRETQALNLDRSGCARPKPGVASPLHVGTKNIRRMQRIGAQIGSFNLPSNLICALGSSVRCSQK